MTVQRGVGRGRGSWWKEGTAKESREEGRERGMEECREAGREGRWEDQVKSRERLGLGKWIRESEDWGDSLRVSES